MATGSQDLKWQLHGSQDLTLVEFQSFVRGYHSYQTVWDPKRGDLLSLERETTNCKDKFAVAVVDRSSVVGHLPYNIATSVSHFLKEVSTINGMVEVTGKQVNQGAGYGLEIPFRLYDPKAYIEKLKELISKIRAVTVAPADSSSVK